MPLHSRGPYDPYPQFYPVPSPRGRHKSVRRNDDGQAACNNLANAYAAASVAFNTALVVSLESLAEVYPVSIEDQDDLLINARQALDNLFGGAAKRLDDEGIDGSAVLARTASECPFDDEAAAQKRFSDKFRAELPNPESKTDFASASVVNAGDA